MVVGGMLERGRRAACERERGPGFWHRAYAHVAGFASWALGACWDLPGSGPYGPGPDRDRIGHRTGVTLTADRRGGAEAERRGAPAGRDLWS